MQASRRANVLSLTVVLFAELGSHCSFDRSPVRSRPPSPTVPITNAVGEEPEDAGDVPPPPAVDSGAPKKIPPGCGDGARADDEACDDGNTRGGDGCSADCLNIERGYACASAGTPCRVIARCGDGVVSASEGCDDGNTKAADGCSEKCALEPGFGCSGDPSVCTPAKCGDGKLQGAESCDDGNALPFDGCSSVCQIEPDCRSGACSSKCGDGLLIDEECDDGNTKNGDGCSASCKVESGYQCKIEGACLEDPCVLHITVLYRDFDVSHPDFGVSCGDPTKGVVEDRLGADGKPLLADGKKVCIQSADSFHEWYTTNKNNSGIPGELTLYDDGVGGFVNRFGPNGEPWFGPKTYLSAVFGGPAGSRCSQCKVSGKVKCYDPCVPWNSKDVACCAEERAPLPYDGTPLFFPIDDAPNLFSDERYPAKIPEEYGYVGWPWEDDIFPGAPPHNFHFTTEVVHWFRYDPKLEARLDFNGDDDVWVFVNNRLAVDLGGPHVPQNGAVTLDADGGKRFELELGKVYEVHVFHAERKVEGSTFRLTLAGLDTERSYCALAASHCGDGVVIAGEECDDGTNDGGYEECDKDCKLGPRCGDGVVQDGENCDDGNRADDDGCGSSCRTLRSL